MMSGQRLKSIRFKLPIIENDLSIGLDNGEHVETVVLLSKLKPDDMVEIKVDLGGVDAAAETKAAYPINIMAAAV